MITTGCARSWFVVVTIIVLTSVSIRVSNELGAGRPRLARLAIWVALSLVVVEGTSVAAAMILGRKGWGYCFSSEEEVVKYVDEMLVLIAVCHFIDGIQTIFSGFSFFVNPFIFILPLTLLNKSLHFSNPNIFMSTYVIVNCQIFFNRWT